MNDQGWLRLLEIVAREEALADAFVQIGGEVLDDPRTVSVPLSGTRRLVAVCAEAPENPEGLRERLLSLCDAFHDAQRGDDGPAPTGSASRSELDHALAEAASHARAESALVFDVDSPVLWGCSAADGLELDRVQLEETAQVDAAVRQAGLRWDSLLDRGVDATLEAMREGLGDGTQALVARVVERLHALWTEHGRHAVHRRLRMARAVREVCARSSRHDVPAASRVIREPDVHCVCREFATLYRLLLVFAQPFSPLHAEATLQRRLDHIERLVLALPPVDPGGGRKSRAARVLRLV